MWTKWLIWIVLLSYLGLSQSDEADVSIFCKSGWSQFRNKCYKLEGEEIRDRLYRRKAAAKCISYGGNLAIIGSEEVQEFLVSLVPDLKANVWIGLKGNDSGSYWDDGSTVRFTKWMSINPTRHPNYTDVDCASMNFEYEDVNSDPGDWTIGFSCRSVLPYICMAELSLTESGAALDSIFCKSGWAQFRDKCYTLKGKEYLLNRDQASADCVYENGNLVTIGSKEVQDFLVYFLVSDLKWNVWIGLKRNNSGSYWDDGSSVKYTNWISEKPTRGGTHSNVDCAAMKFMNVQANTNPGEWSTGFTCSSSLAYICMAELSYSSYKVAFIISITLVAILVVILGSVIYYLRTKGVKHGRLF